MLSGTVLQGAGKDRTELQHNPDAAPVGYSAPIYGYNADLVALRNLTVTNIRTSGNAGLILKDSTRVAVQGVRMNLGAKTMAWMYGNKNIAVTDSEFLQTGSIDAPGSSHVTHNAGLVFTRNRISFLNNIGTDFDYTHDAYVAGNHWTRDAVRQHDPGVAHTVTVNFSHRIAIVGNSFDTINGPVDQTKNDGETILTEGGALRRTEGLGQVVSATATTVSDPTATINPNALINKAIPENFGIAIVAGRGMGQTRQVTAFKAGTFTVERAWDLQPDRSSRYATAVWGIEKAVIKANVLTNNPRGIWLYSTAARDIDMVDNTMRENGGILVRSFQKADKNWLSPIYNIRIESNSISNTTRRYQSYLSVHFANYDGQAVGTSHIGVEVRRNSLTANNPNTDGTNFMGPAGREGYMIQMNVETSSYVATDTPRLLGTLMQGNSCTNCATAFRLATGASGTVLADNQLTSSGALWMNTSSVNSGELALRTLVRQLATGD